MQNSLDNRQAISDALDESFATIDFSPEISSCSEDESHHNVPKHEIIKTNNNDAIENSVKSLSTEEEFILPAPEIQTKSAIVEPPPVILSADIQIKTNYEPIIVTSINAEIKSDQTNLQVPNQEEVSKIDIIERVTSVDDSVTPYFPVDNDLGLEFEPKSLNDWSIRTLPDPPSGFKDSIPNSTGTTSEHSENSENPIMPGPMKFSIDSYQERTLKEEPYNLKLSRAESFRDEPVLARLVPEKPLLSKSESFSLARFTADSTISGNSTFVTKNRKQAKCGFPIGN